MNTSTTTNSTITRQSMMKAANPVSIKPLKLMVIGIVALSLSYTASAKEMYKWKDENGVIHFTDKPPLGVEAEKINKKSRRPSEDENNPNTDSEDAKKVTAKQANAERCAAEKKRLDVLNSSKSIRMKMDDGSTKVLSAEEIAQEIAFAQKAIDYFCE